MSEQRLRNRLIVQQIIESVEDISDALIRDQTILSRLLAEAHRIIQNAEQVPAHETSLIIKDFQKLLLILPELPTKTHLKKL